MPILDHFRPPLDLQWPWDCFLADWARSLADALNRQLPSGIFAEDRTPLDEEREIRTALERAAHQGKESAVSTPVPPWVPPAPALTLPFTFAETFEVRIFGTRGGPRPVAAIELVCPANKDWPGACQAFAHKCASYLHDQVSLIVVDLVTGRETNLHNELMRLLGMPAESHQAAEALLYAAAYRPVFGEEHDELHLWTTPLEIGGSLPVLPLAVTEEVVLPVDLQAAYEDACQRRQVFP